MEKIQSISLQVNSTHNHQVSFLEKLIYFIDIVDTDESVVNTIDFEIVSTKGLFACMRFGEPPRFILNDYVFPDVRLSDGTHVYTRTFRVRDLKKGRWYIGIRGTNLLSPSKYSIYVKGRKEVYPEKSESNESLTTSIFNFFDSIFNPNHDANTNNEELCYCTNYPFSHTHNVQNDSNLNVESNVNNSNYFNNDNNNDNNDSNSHYFNNNNDSNSNKEEESHFTEDNRRFSAVDMGDWIIVNDESSPAGRRGKAELLVEFNEEETLPLSNRSSLDLEQKKLNRLSCNPPRQFICPITQQLMRRPVVASDGHSYEYLAISKWLEGYIRSPMTGQEMPSKLIIPNFNLKSMIDEWLAAHPGFED